MQTKLTGKNIIASAARKQLLKSATVSSLSKTVEQFMHALHVGGDTTRAMRFFSINSPLVSPQEQLATAEVLSIIANKYKARKFFSVSTTNTNKQSCANNVAVDRFCIVPIQSIKFTNTERVNFMRQLVHRGIRQIPIFDTLFLVAYSFEFEFSDDPRDKTGNAAMIILWVKEPNGWKLLQILESKVYISV